MRGVLLTTVFIFLLHLNSTASPQTYEMYEGDTINMVDVNSKKQGYWIIFGRMKNVPGFSADQRIEEGEYVNSKKQGLWKKYYPNEQLKSEITYKNNRPSGTYKLFYENGNVEEEGVWKNNRQTGKFKRYYQSGQVMQDFSFAENGKRNGEQLYYHENGQLEVKVNIVEGKEEGLMQRWYPNGDLKEEKVFNGGVVDPASVKTYEPTQPVVEVEEEKLIPEKTTTVNTTDQPNQGASTAPLRGIPDGYNKLYNKNRVISQDGYFKNGKLIDGKWYRYDNNGILIRIEIYKNGVYIGDGVIEE